MLINSRRFVIFAISLISFITFSAMARPSFATIGQPCSTENLDPVCDTCNGELCHNFGDSQNPDLRCAAAQINGFVGNTPTFVFGTQPTDGGPQCPSGQLLNVVRNATDTTIDLPGCWNSCSTTVITTSKQGYFNFLGPVCSSNTPYCQGISGGDQSSDCRVGECTSNPTFDSNNPTGCNYTLVPETQNFACALCSNATELGITSCGNGICEGAQGEDCQTCPVDCVIPGFEGSCPLTSGTVIEDACASNIGKKLTTFDGPPFNRSSHQECEDGDVCTDNQCSTDTLTCVASLKACSGDLSDYCCPANCQAPAQGTTSCGNASNCDIDCFAPQTCSDPSPTPTPSNICLFGGGMSMNGGTAGACSSCSLNKTAVEAPRNFAALLGVSLVLTGLFLSIRHKVRR
jgi:hypothetical protein